MEHRAGQVGAALKVTGKPTTILVTIEPDESAFARIRAALPGCEIRVGPMIEESGVEAPAGLMRGVDFYLCEFPPDNFDDFDRVQWIQLSSAGYGQIQDLPILERGIRVTNGLGSLSTMSNDGMPNDE